METPTHYMNVTLALDFKKVFSPEYIQGVKLMLGIENDEEIINTISNNIIIDMGKAIENKASFVSIVNANINPVPASSPEPEPESDLQSGIASETPDMYASDEDGMADGGENDIFGDRFQSEPELEHSDLIYDEYSRNLIDNISNDMFRIESYLGTDIVIYLKQYDKYAPTVRNDLGDINIVSFNELGEQASELQEKDYVLQYQLMNGEVKYGSRDLNKIDEKEQETV